MKKSNLIITSAASLVALIAISGVAFSSFAAEDTATVTDDSTRLRQGRQMMNEENRTQREERFKLNQADFEAKKTAIDSAVKAKDYQAWVAAVGEDCPMLENINEGNFSKYSEAHNLMEQARTIMEELGVKSGERGFGMGGGRGHMMK